MTQIPAGNRRRWPFRSGRQPKGDDRAPATQGAVLLEPFWDPVVVLPDPWRRDSQPTPEEIEERRPRFSWPESTIADRVLLRPSESPEDVAAQRQPAIATPLATELVSLLSEASSLTAGLSDDQLLTRQLIVTARAMNLAAGQNFEPLGQAPETPAASPVDHNSDETIAVVVAESPAAEPHSELHAGDRPSEPATVVEAEPVAEAEPVVEQPPVEATIVDLPSDTAPAPDVAAIQASAVAALPELPAETGESTVALSAPVEAQPATDDAAVTPVTEIAEYAVFASGSATVLPEAEASSADALIAAFEKTDVPVELAATILPVSATVQEEIVAITEADSVSLAGSALQEASAQISAINQLLSTVMATGEPQEGDAAAPGQTDRPADDTMTVHDLLPAMAAQIEASAERSGFNTVRPPVRAITDDTPDTEVVEGQSQAQTQMQSSALAPTGGDGSENGAGSPAGPTEEIEAAADLASAATEAPLENPDPTDHDVPATDEPSSEVTALPEATPVDPSADVAAPLTPADASATNDAQEPSTPHDYLADGIAPGTVEEAQAAAPEVVAEVATSVDLPDVQPVTADSEAPTDVPDEEASAVAEPPPVVDESPAEPSAPEDVAVEDVDEGVETPVKLAPAAAAALKSTASTVLAPAVRDEYNRTNVDFRRPWPRPKVRGLVIDYHCHLLARRHAEDWFEAADHYGMDVFVTQSPLEEAVLLARDYGHRLRFTAVPQWGDGSDNWVDKWLNRIEAFYNLGSRIAKFHAAPGTMAMRGHRLDSPVYKPLFAEVRARGMAIMTHIGDPDTWYNGKYDPAKFGTREEHYQMWENLLEEHRGHPWIGAHLGGNPEDLPRLQRLLDKYPDLILDCSATRWMVREVSARREPAREFFIRNADRILFGSDQVSGDDRHFDFLASRIWCHRKLWETAYIGPSPIIDPDVPVDQQPVIRGLALPDTVLQKIYHDNTTRLLAQLGMGFE